MRTLEGSAKGKDSSAEEARLRCNKLEKDLSDLQKTLLEKERGEVELKNRANEAAALAAKQKLESKFKSLRKIMADLSKSLQAVKLGVSCNYCL
jgi:dsDNA-specific endonuclease/ATPase MutS2